MEYRITVSVNNCDHEKTLDGKFEGDAVVVTERLHFEETDQIEIENGEEKEWETVDPVEVGVELLDTHDAWF